VFPLQVATGQRLQSMPSFGAIRDDVLRFLLAQTREVVVQTGESFFRENDPASSIYVLEAGHPALIKGRQVDNVKQHGR